MGTFGAAIGLKGEIKINLLTSNFEVFKSLERYYNFDQSTEWKFDFIKMRNDKCVAFPSHCKNRDDAENLKNQKIFASKDKFPKTKSKVGATIGVPDPGLNMFSELNINLLHS